MRLEPGIPNERVGSKTNATGDGQGISTVWESYMLLQAPLPNIRLRLIFKDVDGPTRWTAAAIWTRLGQQDKSLVRRRSESHGSGSERLGARGNGCTVEICHIECRAQEAREGKPMCRRLSVMADMACRLRTL